MPLPNDGSLQQNNSGKTFAVEVKPELRMIKK